MKSIYPSKILELISLQSEYKALTYVPGFKKFWKPLLFETTSFLPKEAGSSERFWYVKNNTKETPVCLFCGGPVRFANPICGYVSYCSPICSGKSPITQAKVRATNLEKFGVEHSGLALSSIEKRNQTMIDRYGAAHPSQSKSIRKKKANNFLNRLMSRIDGIVIPKFDFETYTNRYGLYQWECCKCSTEFEDDVRNGGIPRCPTCFPYMDGFSRAEKEVVQFIQSIYKEEIVENTKDIIYPFELDIYLPNIRLAIEYCGLYWHSSFTNKDENYHLNKLNRCRKNNVRLITLFEDEWVHQKEYIKQRISNIISNKETIEYEIIKDNKIYVDKRWDIPHSFFEECILLETSPSNSFYLRPNEPQKRYKNRSSIEDGIIFDCGYDVYALV